jgi:hypothetical protein
LVAAACLEYVFGLTALAPMAHGDRAAAEPLRGHQIERSRTGQPVSVQDRTVTAIAIAIAS